MGFKIWTFYFRFGEACRRRRHSVMKILGHLAGSGLLSSDLSNAHKCLLLPLAETLENDDKKWKTPQRAMWLSQMIHCTIFQAWFSLLCMCASNLRWYAYAFACRCEQVFFSFLVDSTALRIFIFSLLSTSIEINWEKNIFFYFLRTNCVVLEVFFLYSSMR